MSRNTQYLSQHAVVQLKNYPESEENVLRKYLPCIPRADLALIPEAISKSTLQHFQEYQAHAQQQQQQHDCSGLQDYSFQQEISPLQPLQFSYNSPALTRLVIDRIVGQLDVPKEYLDTQFHLLHMRTLAQEQEKTIQRAMIEGDKSKFQKKAADFDKHPRGEPQLFSQAFYAKQLSLQEQYISPRYYSSILSGTQKQQRIDNSQLGLGVRSQGQISNTAKKDNNSNKNNSQQNFLLSSRSQNMYNQKCQPRNIENQYSYSASKGIINCKETPHSAQQPYLSEDTIKQGIITAALCSQSSASSSSTSSQKDPQLTLLRKGNSTSSSCYDSSNAAAGKENNQNHTVGVINKISKDTKNKRKTWTGLNNHAHTLHQLRREQSQQSQAYAGGNNYAYSSMLSYQEVLSAPSNNVQGSNNSNGGSQQSNFYDVYASQNQQQQPYNNSSNTNNGLRMSITNSNNSDQTCNDNNNYQQKQLNQNFQERAYYYLQSQSSQACTSSAMNGLLQNFQQSDFTCFKQLDDVFEAPGDLERCVRGNDENNNANGLVESDASRRLSSHNLSNSCGFEDFFQSLSDSGTMGSSIIQEQHQIAVVQDSRDMQQQQQQLHQQMQPESPGNRRNNNSMAGQSPLDEEEDMINNYLA